jgi:hypothetical protein
MQSKHKRLPYVNTSLIDKYSLKKNKEHKSHLEKTEN